MSKNCANIGTTCTFFSTRSVKHFFIPLLKENVYVTDDTEQ